MADIKITVDSSEIKRATQHTTELEGATTRFGTKLDPLLKKEKAFAKAVKQVNDAMRLGVATQKQAIAEIERLGRAYGQTQAQIDRTTASMTGIRKNTNRMNATIQNAGYQFGDFFVQVQSGQNILVAFSQQGAQLAGLMPGLAGAVTGVGLVIGSMLVRALMDGSGAMKGLAEAIESAEESLGNFRSQMKKVTDGFRKELGPEIKEFSEALLKKNLQQAIEDVNMSIDKMTGRFSKLQRELNKAGFAYGKDELRANLQAVKDEIQSLSDVDPSNAQELRDAISTVSKLISGELAPGIKLSKTAMESLETLGKEFAETLEAIVPETEEQTEELKKQKDLLSEIVDLEKTRDRISKNLEQRFADSTRRLELIKSGVSSGLAGKTVSLENLIAETIEAERDLQSQLMNPLQLQKYMGEFERALKVRLEGYTAEQVAIEKLLSDRRAAGKETEYESIYGQAIGPVKPEEGSRGGFDITPAAEENRKQIERQIELAGLLSDSFVGAFRDIANGTETASDAFKKMTIAIIQHIMDVLIFKPLIESLTNALSPTSLGGSAVGGLISNLFPAANGAAIDNGNVVPFAYGGVVNSPTMFGMSGGRTGLMGEAGPEAILPLKRGAGGKLGVEGGGNVTVHQSFNFAANGDESVKRIIAEAAPGIAKMTEAQIVNSRQRGGQMRRVFS
jgi:hypothetical protein